MFLMARKKVPVQNKTLYRMYMAFEVLRSLEREFPAQLVTTFLYIASHNGCRQEDLMDATSLSSSSVSRNVTWLGPKHRLGREGLRFVYREKDPDDPKRYLIYLSRKGEQMAKLIENTLTQPL
ncbi:transcriptional regulator [Cyanophage SS120-1]|uniref:MarR family protein n=1 Tax=Cyanophage SS120-1 TaxID=616674 RepID=M1UAA2_9CAUD|nr:transcriptional regulator [Cyanophage SS120-1]AGG54506.1 MarR family protein [Cyanophage SS120-1]